MTILLSKKIALQKIDKKKKIKHVTKKRENMHIVLIPNLLSIFLLFNYNRIQLYHLVKEGASHASCSHGINNCFLIAKLTLVNIQSTLIFCLTLCLALLITKGTHFSQKTGAKILCSWNSLILPCSPPFIGGWLRETWNALRIFRYTTTQAEMSCRAGRLNASKLVVNVRFYVFYHIPQLMDLGSKRWR